MCYRYKVHIRPNYFSPGAVWYSHLQDRLVAGLFDAGTGLIKGQHYVLTH